MGCSRVNHDRDTLEAFEEDGEIWRETPRGRDGQKVEGQPRGRSAGGTKIYRMGRETQISQAGEGTGLSKLGD